MMWEWSDGSKHTSTRYPLLHQQPFAGTLPASTTDREIERILKAIMISHWRICPRTKLDGYGKKLTWHNPNPKGMDPNSPHCKARRPIHRPPVMKDRQESIVCQAFGNHGLNLRATKVSDLQVIGRGPVFEISWTEPLGSRRTVKAVWEDG